MTATTLRNQAMNSETRLASKVIGSTRDLATASGNVSYTGVGFQPTSIIFMGAVSGGVPVGFGIVDSGKTGRAVSVSTSGNWNVQTAYFLALYANNASNLQVANISSFDTDGFTLAWTKIGSPTGTADIFFLCFR